MLRIKAGKEKTAHDLASTFLAQHGFTVTRGAYGMPTCFEGVFEQGKGGRTVTFTGDLDCVPQFMSFANGHNLMASAQTFGLCLICRVSDLLLLVGAAAAGIVTMHALKESGVAGRIVVLGTPGIEVYNNQSKIYLLRSSAFRNCSVRINHSRPVTSDSLCL